MKLIFVYNANSGKVNAMFDIAHKIFRPETYECSLCMLTHDILTENNVLTALKNDTDFDIIFLHKDEFEAQYNIDVTYPIIFKVLDNNAPKTSLNVLFDHEEIANFTHMQELVGALKASI